MREERECSHRFVHAIKRETTRMSDRGQFMVDYVKGVCDYICISSGIVNIIMTVIDREFITSTTFVGMLSK